MSLLATMDMLVLGAVAGQPLSIGFLVLGIILLLIGIYLSWSASQDAKAYRDSRQELENEIETLKKQAKTPTKTKTNTPKKTPAAPKTKAQPDLTKELNALKKDLSTTQGDLKKLRKDSKQLRDKNHAMTTELQDLRAKDKAARDSKKAQATNSNTQEALVDLRFELAEAKQEVEQWKSRANDLKVELAEQPEPQQIVVREPVAVPEEINLDDLLESDEVKAKIKDIEKQYRAKLSRAKQDLIDTERDLRGKLKRSGITSDRHRRRADNNDKAYTITQRELDAARERVTYLEDQLHKATFAASTVANQLASQTEAQNAREQEKPQTKLVAPTEKVDAPEEVKPAKETTKVSALAALNAPSEVVEEDMVSREEPTKETPVEAQTEIDDSLKLSAESGLVEVSAVDDAWSDFDLD